MNGSLSAVTINGAGGCFGDGQALVYLGLLYYKKLFVSIRFKFTFLNKFLKLTHILI